MKTFSEVVLSRIVASSSISIRNVVYTHCTRNIYTTLTKFPSFTALVTMLTTFTGSDTTLTKNSTTSDCNMTFTAVNKYINLNVCCTCSFFFLNTTVSCPLSPRELTDNSDISTFFFKSSSIFLLHAENNLGKMMHNYTDHTVSEARETWVTYVRNERKAFIEENRTE